MRPLLSEVTDPRPAREQDMLGRRFAVAWAVIVASLCVVNSYAETATVGNCTWTYKENNGVWKIESVETTTNEIVVPATLGGKYISVICSNAFNHCYWLKSVKISVGFKTIGDSAFKECKYLERVELPQGLLAIGSFAFMGCLALKSVVIPDTVSFLGSYSFHGCTGLKELVLPDSVLEIGYGAFNLDCSLESVRLPNNLEILRPYLFMNCTSLTNVILGPECWCIMDEVFSNCMELKKITIPEKMEYFAGDVFAYCDSLEQMDFEGWPPEFVGDPCIPKDLHIRYNVEYIEDWAVLIDEYGFTNAEAYYPEKPKEPEEEQSNRIYLTVTNVVVQYVLNSIRPDIAVPATPDTGFVNIITEVNGGGAVAIPSSWANNYPNFEAKFGSDFTKALTMKTGKRDGAGNEMFVWQDYVAGTDPTNPESKFTASITIVNCEPVISWSPELTPEQAALRKYTTYGKVSLADEKWNEVAGDAAKYNFFKVAVEMR